MTRDRTSPEDEYSVPAAIYERLATATPAERGGIVLRLLQEHAGKPLALPTLADGSHVVLDGVELGREVPKRRRRCRTGAGEGPATARTAASLRGADLRGARLRNAKLAGVDLGDADLRNAALGAADLRGALLNGANLRGADLAGANLAGASLGTADLGGAMLEDANLRRARLRFANLEGAALEHADLRAADLWGARVAGADLASADLRGAVLHEADFRSTDLSRADLRGAACAGANFDDAVLSGANLQRLDLTGCTIARVHLSETWLEKTRLGRDQLGGAIGEELRRDYDEARKGYLALERAFQDLGDHDAASWAYRRRRRMQKLSAWRQARAAGGLSRWRAWPSYFQCAGDQVSEWVCDYGESIPRALASLLVLYLFFTLIYGLTGSVVREVETPSGVRRVVTRNPKDLAIFSLLAVSTSGSPTVGLLPRNESVHFLTAAEALLGIGLTGLLGFVVGNRVRR
ncbi:MAG: pentapeptide repeat-containing protein [Isosphaeraceae bacterium]|nr:pentapeptide repeat-containing protein [Isosphaeraceae bacterium]